MKSFFLSCIVLFHVCIESSTLDEKARQEIDQKYPTAVYIFREVDRRLGTSDTEEAYFRLNFQDPLVKLAMFGYEEVQNSPILIEMTIQFICSGKLATNPSLAMKWVKTKIMSKCHALLASAWNPRFLGAPPKRTQENDIRQTPMVSNISLQSNHTPASSVNPIIAKDSFDGAKPPRSYWWVKWCGTCLIVGWIGYYWLRNN